MADLFKSGSVAQFLLYGNVFDVVPAGPGNDCRLLSLKAFLNEVMFERYDVVLVDQRMPGPGGLGVVEELRRTGACDEIYVITAYADRPLVRQALDSGARQVFVKPLDIPLLLESIGAATAETERRSPYVPGGGEKR
jgi:FixJ family two-component response regulator